MVLPDDFCGYCKKHTDDLDRLNNTELLDLMKQHNASYTRRTRFCKTCKDRAIVKLRRRKLNEKLIAKRASTSADDKTTSYSNASNPVLSQTSSQSESRSPRRQRQDQAGPSRNVAKRTGGRPNKPTDPSSEDSSTSTTRSRSPFAIPLTQSSDGNGNASNQRTSPQYSSSMQSAPMPHNRGQRTRSLTRPPTPDRMASMSSEERSQVFRTFNRGTAG